MRATPAKISLPTVTSRVGVWAGHYPELKWSVKRAPRSPNGSRGFKIFAQFGGRWLGKRVRYVDDPTDLSAFWDALDRDIGLLVNEYEFGTPTPTQNQRPTRRPRTNVTLTHEGDFHY